MTNKIKAILFDLDGVLVDTCDMHKDALNKALLKVAGFSLTEEEHLSRFNGLPTKVKLTSLVEEGRLKPDLLDEVNHLKQEYSVEYICDNLDYDFEKISMMTRLKNDGYKLGCYTNCIKKTANLILSKIGLLPYTSSPITNEDVKYPKPHPEGYLRLMSSLNVLPSNSLIIEDSPKGVAAASSSGAFVLKATSPYEVNYGFIISGIRIISKWHTID